MHETVPNETGPPLPFLPPQAVPCDLGKFGDFLSSHYIPNRVIVDCTASDAPASHYIDWMKQVRRGRLTRVQQAEDRVLLLYLSGLNDDVGEGLACDRPACCFPLC